MRRQPVVVKGLAAQWGDNVADRRRMLGFTQKQLAEFCHVEQQTISKIESGRMIPLDRLKIELSRSLGTDPQTLFAWPAMSDLVSRQAS